MKEEMLKKIVSTFIKCSTDSIEADTIIDNSVIQGSILFHRMISRINKYYGIEIEDYTNIKTYSDLLKEVRGKYE
tara:strand:- start:940 stop:1164 length:225 start_codon:yes stop_codon:yes gene_type:complete